MAKLSSLVAKGQGKIESSVRLALRVLQDCTVDFKKRGTVAFQVEIASFKYPQHCSIFSLKY